MTTQTDVKVILMDKMQTDIRFRQALFSFLAKKRFY